MNKFIASLLVSVMTSLIVGGLIYLTLRLTHTTQLSANSVVFGFIVYVFVDVFTCANKEFSNYE